MGLRLVLAEDNYLVREGVRRLLESRPGLDVVACCGNLDELLAAVDSESPDVLVTDIRMPPGGIDEGIQAAQRLRTTHPEVGVVVLSQFTDPSYAKNGPFALMIHDGGQKQEYKDIEIEPDPVDPGRLLSVKP